MRYGVIIHGGAWDIPDELVQAHLKGVMEACEVANAILKRSNGNALDAAEESISIMEDNPTFDAGKGSFVNQIAEVEMDAIIATDDYKIGSVCAIQNVSNPVKIARLIMEKTDHIMLAGNGANLFAKEMGIQEVSPESLLIGRELERYNEIKKRKQYESKDAFRKLSKPHHMGTVGCVCLDQKKRISVALSTGGTPYKKAGRVGDTPLWGSGAYLESSIGGAAATGYGEDLIRILATKTCIQYLHSQLSIQDATNRTIIDLREKVAGLGGIIGLTSHSVGLSFNTPRMAFAYQIEDEEIVYGINPQDLP
ncbi:MAG: isoaspartyl peptidase/L-asparaginase family protein [Candidatus Hodarchaeales archaeon]|jgi:beta-aspartyl-peptidase (threonine type)